jgi:hypothetical protein
VQTCSRCHTQSQDDVIVCPSCQADLREFSDMAQALTRFQNNPRVNAIRIQMSEDACPACQEMASVYEKGEVPSLPVRGCSHENGCRCFYSPILEEIFP